MRFKRYLKESTRSTWSDWIKLYRRNKKEAENIKKQVLKDLKMERIKNPMTKYAGVGKSFDKIVTQDKRFRIEMVGGHGTGGTYKSGKERLVWRVWDEKRGQYHAGQHKTLAKAKDALVSFLMKNDMVHFQVPQEKTQT